MDSASTTINSPTVSYAKMVQQVQYPTKEQAIILDSIEGLSVQDYTIAIGNLVQPSNIRYVSRISHGRVCIYLSSKELADKVTDNHTTVKVGTHTLEIRPLISKSKRIIISNVCPIIPAHVIEKELSKFDIKPNSKITNIRAAISVPGYAHVLSFRRQMYVNPEDIKKLPETLQISYDDTVYWLYLSAEKLTCFLCKEEGHLAKHCKKSETENQHSSKVTNKEQKKLENETVNSQTSETNNNPNMEMLPPSGTKRPLSSSTSTSTTNEVEIAINKAEGEPKNKKIIKKAKKSVGKSEESTAIPSISEITEKLEPAREHLLHNAQKYPLDFENISQFLSATHGKSDIIDVAHKYTADIPSLINMLTEIYGFLQDRNIKSRITRIKNRIQNSITDETTNDDMSLTDESETY